MSEKQHMIEDSKRFILKNIQNMDVIKSAANQIQMSYESFRKAFAWQTGESLGQYCKRLKIDLAKTLLSTTNWKILIIAKECGYQSERAFNRAFKRIVGKTPGQFRLEPD